MWHYIRLFLVVVPAAIVVNLAFDAVGLEHAVFRPMLAGLIVGAAAVLVGRKLGFLSRSRDD